MLLWPRGSRMLSRRRTGVDRLCADLWQSHCLQHPGDHLIGIDLVGERVVAQHKSMPEHIGHDFDDVLRDHVVTAADQGQILSEG